MAWVILSGKQGNIEFQKAFDTQETSAVGPGSELQTPPGGSWQTASELRMWHWLGEIPPRSPSIWGNDGHTSF